MASDSAVMKKILALEKENQELRQGAITFFALV
jgi:hypothetical protein